MAEAHKRLGRIPCLCCGDSTSVRENAAGTLSMACQECGLSIFAKKGEGAHGRIMGKLKPEGSPAPAPASKPNAGSGLLLS